MENMTEDWADLAHGIEDLTDEHARSRLDSVATDASHVSQDVPAAPVVAAVQAVPDTAPFRAFLSNLSFKATEDDLRTFFNEKGCTVIDVSILRADGKSRGTAFMEFDNKADLITALGVSGSTFMGRELHVNVAKSRGKHNDRNGNRGRGHRQNNRHAQDDARFANIRDRDVAPRHENAAHQGESSEEVRASRPRLNLKPRTVSTPVGVPDKVDSQIFGDGKAVDKRRDVKATGNSRDRVSRARGDGRNRDHKSGSARSGHGTKRNETARRNKKSVPYSKAKLDGTASKEKNNSRDRQEDIKNRFDVFDSSSGSESESDN